MRRQQELYLRTPMERAIELASWLRNEIDTMRLRLNAEQIELRQLELSLRKVQDIRLICSRMNFFNEHSGS